MTGNSGKKFHKKKPGYYSTTQHRDPNTMDIDAMTIEERQKRLQDGACFICAEPGHFSNKCPNRKGKRSQDNRKPGRGSTPQNKGKGRMNPRDFKTHIREMVIDNFGADPAKLEDFMDMVEEEGF